MYQTSVGVNPNESQNTGVFSTIANGFFIAAELDPDVIQQTRLFFTLLFIGIYAAFVLAILWLSWMNSRKTVLSIKYLLSVLEMHDFQRDIVLSIPQDTYELAVIKEAVLKLMDGISAANDAANQALQENMRLSLELLQYKLNPHLLYNSLTLISLIATQKKDTETIRVVDALVDYYRSVMKKTDVSTIGEELDSLRLFVNINAISQRKDIQLIIESDDRLSSIAIPHLLLQPIVENAVGHGLASMLKDCLIRIHVYREGKYVHVDIFDNGIGIEEDILAELNRRQGARLGYGVNNTYERLRLFSDGNCGMQFESVPYQETVAHLWFKIPEAKDSLSSL